MVTIESQHVLFFLSKCACRNADCGSWAPFELAPTTPSQNRCSRTNSYVLYGGIRTTKTFSISPQGIKKVNARMKPTQLSCSVVITNGKQGWASTGAAFRAVHLSIIEKCCMLNLEKVLCLWLNVTKWCAGVYWSPSE